MFKTQNLLTSIGKFSLLVLVAIAVYPLFIQTSAYAAAPDEMQAAGECAVTAVSLIGAWVNAGAAEGSFPFTATDGQLCTGDFSTDVLPLFSTDNIWFEGSEACTNCHFDNSEDSRHEMDLSSLEGILRGADALSEPPGVPVVVPGDWENSKLRARLRDNRMPPGWEFDIEETNRDGPTLTVDGAEVTAVSLIGAWVDSGAEEGLFEWADDAGTAHTASFADDVQPLFTTENAWFEGSEACTNCHFDNSEDSRHEMDLSNIAGILRGADALSEPPGVPIVVPGDWEHSKLRSRLRDNRMPPGWEFDIEETNRDGPTIMAGVKAAAPTAAVTMSPDDCNIYAVDLIGAWVDAGAKEGTFTFTDVNGQTCTGDFNTNVQPLFTTDNIWFEGSEACTNCHFDNSEDSRHEMDLSSLEGILRGADALSEPPGVPIIVPGDWEGSKLRSRLRDNRMPPGWEFDIEETNRDGPTLTVDGVEITAVSLIGAWVDSGAEEGIFEWADGAGAAHTASFADDIQPLFTTDNIWFDGSEACTNCHFDNSEDSRHEMDLSSLAGIMRGGDVLSEPPGVAIVLPGDWEHSKLRARLRDNRMPPGWEFDIEETNRDGPIVQGGVPLISGATSVLQGDCDIYAVDLIGAWVDAGAPEGIFTFTDADGQGCTGDFNTDVQPLFTTDNIWFNGSEACTNCHFDNSEDSRHEMDLSSLAGILRGADALSEPPGVPIIVPGDWESSKLRARLRDNRMPPGWEFDIEETNRDGPTLTVDGVEITAVSLIGAWVDSGAEEGIFEWADAAGATHTASFADDIQPLFTTDNIWFDGSEACTNCHFDNSEDSRHEMDLSNIAGILRGADALSEPPGVPIVVPGDWEHSKLRSRLRDNRMPPGWEFDIEETNRDGPMVQVGVKNSTAAATVLQGDCDVYAIDLIGAWVNAGATEGTFPFEAIDGKACTGDFNTDVQPLFTTDNIWFNGSEACTNCHFDNSEDSRHEMDLSNIAGILRGADALSEPPGVPIVVPGDWEGSKLRARLRDNRMPPGWEFDIEETNRDGPTLTVDGVEITAVSLIGAWVDSGAEEGVFEWADATGTTHTASFADDIQPLFTTENAWFDGSEACTNCHFDNSEDSRHEMDLSNIAGILRGADALSEPPGVPIVVPGDWEHSKLRARLRDNRMPPGWEFDIEETNRDGPLVKAGLEADGAAASTVATAAEAPPLEIVELAREPFRLPDPIVTQNIVRAQYSPMFLGLMGGISLVFAVIMLFIFGSQARKQANAVNVAGLLFAFTGLITGGLALHAVISDTFTQTVSIHEERPIPFEVPPEIPLTSEVRVEEWQARIPEAYANLTNPYANDPAAAAEGEQVFKDGDCYECHGETLQGDGKLSAGLLPKPSNLTDPILMGLPFMTDNYLFWRVSEGGAQPPFFSAMPAWKHLISEDDRWKVVTFIRSQASGGAVDEGEQAAIAIIERNGCFACHRLEHLGRGGKIGPSWTELPNVAGTRREGLSAEEYVRQSILAPDAFYVPGYEDANPMPLTFSESITPEELDILVAYLLGPGDD